MGHINIEHLSAIAEDGTVFTVEEFEHVKKCSFCLDQWSDHIREFLRHERLCTTGAAHKKFALTRGAKPDTPHEGMGGQ